MASTQDIIRELPIGKGNAISANELERRIGNQPTGTNNDETRRDVSLAILEGKIPVGSSSSSGYWLINSDEECSEVTSAIQSTINSYQEKIRAIQQGWEQRRNSLGTDSPWPK
jgi:uncharacterized lipoprotein YmbA